MSGVFIRILLRYVAAALVASGALSSHLVDAALMEPELVDAILIGAGALLGLLTEYWYVLAKRFGWAT